MTEDHLAHRENEKRKRERRAHPKPAAHAGKLGVFSFVERWRYGLERHPANGAIARSVTDDLGMHGARIRRAKRRAARVFVPRCGVLCGGRSLVCSLAATVVLVFFVLHLHISRVDECCFQ
jgi:hypothetical protein